MTDAGPPTIDPPHAWAVSLAFWLCLVVAAAMYASVALAPKLLNYLTLKHEHDAHQGRLVALERQVQYLGKVVHALEHDPEFAAELARVNFDAARPGDERIPVDRALSLDAQAEPWPATPAGDLPWYTPLVRRLASGRRLRMGTLAAAALLLVWAFTFLNESQTAPPQTPDNGPVASFRRLTNRYRKPRGGGV